MNLNIRSLLVAILFFVSLLSGFDQVSTDTTIADSAEITVLDGHGHAGCC